MDCAWPGADDLRRLLREDADLARACMRRVVDAAGGSLARMARLLCSNRMGCWRLLSWMGLLDYQRAAQRRAENEYGWRGAHRGIRPETWHLAYGARFAP